MNKKIIHTVFESRVATAPARIAVTEGSRELSYEALNAHANRLAHSLRRFGLEKEEVVAAILPSSINLVATLLGVFKASGIYLPIDIAFSRASLRHALVPNAPSFIVTCTEWLDSVKILVRELELPVQKILVWDNRQNLEALVPAENGWQPLEGYEPATLPTFTPQIWSTPQDGNYIFYTSGSTGTGKAILGCHNSLSHFIHWELKEFGVDENTRVSLLIQHTFDASLRDILLPLSAGGTLCIPPRGTRENLPALVRWMNDQRVNLIHTVPSFFRAIAQEIEGQNMGPALGTHLKHILLSGEPISYKDLSAWQETLGDSIEIVNFYGPTEATMIKSFHRVKGAVTPGQQGFIHAGKGIDNTVMAVINDGALCSVGEIGEIYIITPFLTKGYLREPQKMAESFVQNPLVTDREEIVYKTGDFGRYLDTYDLQVLGRVDDQVKVNGIRVNLNDIREVVLKNGSVRGTEIVAYKDANDNQALVCYFTGTLTETELQDHLEEELSRNVLPSSYIKLEEFPLNINGKIDKKALPKPEEITNSQQEYKAPVGRTEQLLETICREVLDLKRMSRDASFFKMGGTSLKAIMYISQIFRHFGCSVSLKDVFANDTIEKLAVLVGTLNASQCKDIPAIAPAANYELSHAQKRLWVIDQLEEESVNYNMSFVSIVEGPLDRDLLERALTALVQRHESLRSSFRMVDGTPRMVVNEARDYKVNFTDIREFEDGSRLVDALIVNEFRLPFNLQSESLLRVSLIRQQEERYVFILSMHHIISDGWSLEVMLHELFALYKAFQQGKENPFAPLRIQYKDFAAWQNSQLQGDTLRQLENYWERQLSGDLNGVDFPADLPQQNLLHSGGDYLEFSVGEELTAKLEALASTATASNFMLMTAAVNILLYRYTGQSDLIIGTPSATRSHPDLEGQVGLYINVVPLRTQFGDGEETFPGILARVKKTVLDGLANDLYPYDMLVEKLVPDSYRSQFPLINVLVQSQQILDRNDAVPAGLSITDYEGRSMTSKVDMTFNFKREKGVIKAAIEYDAGLYKRATIERVADNLLHILKTAVADKNVPLSKLRLLLDEREQQEQEAFKRLMMGV